MRSFIAAAAFAALAKAQEFDWDLVLQATPIPDITVPVVYATVPTATATATTVTYVESAAAASITQALAANPSDDFPLDSGLAKRDASTCIVQPTGSGPVPPTDSPSDFLAYSSFGSIAASAPTPSGYVNTFSNLQASNNAYGYMGYTLMSSYDTQSCADKCTNINGCQAFNIYYERDPTVNPDSDDCSNPASTTQIKCVFWSGPVTPENANNDGQWRNQFQVVIAGSNGYVNQSIATPAGYNAGVFLGPATVNAPLDCAGDDTFLESKMFTGIYDAGLCASACNTQADYARSTVNTGFVKTCQFFTSYIIYKNGEEIGQYCALYDRTWSSSYATNTGYYYGNDHYTIGFSYSFSNKTDPGQPRIACDVASASSAIISTSSLQPFCSTLLSYSALVDTTTVTVAPTTLVTSSSTDVFAKRSLATPSPLNNFPASAVTSACSLAVTQQSVASYATATVTTSPAPTVL